MIYMNNKAIITGITGQDGTYLAASLLRDGYEIFGTYRRSSCDTFHRLRELGIYEDKSLHLIEHDLTDAGATIRLLQNCAVSEVYNLAAQTFVGASFHQPIATANITGLGAVNLLEAIRNVDPTIRFYQASSSEMFGIAEFSPQNEQTPFNPVSPYGAAKLYAHNMTNIYRRAYGIFAVSGILFNHESPLRGREFVTRKIAQAAVKIKFGMLEELHLGSLDSKRDWGYAPEYVEGIKCILHNETPDCFVLATGVTASVRDFLLEAFRYIGIEIKFSGSGMDEVGIDSTTGKIIVRIDPQFYRPTELHSLVGDSSKAKAQLAWEPKVTWRELSRIMVEAELKRYSENSQIF